MYTLIVAQHDANAGGNAQMSRSRCRRHRQSDSERDTKANKPFEQQTSTPNELVW